MRVASGKPRGRPTKKTPQAVARILKVARTGLPLRFAAQAGDIDEDTSVLWRANDPEFAHALSHARLAGIEDRWKLIKKAALGTEEKPGDWKAVAWQLERAYPGDFARPEVALNLAMQNNVTPANSGGADRRLEAVIVSDLEFSALSKNPAYRHQAGEKPVRDIQVETVPLDLSGTLVRSGYPDTVVISRSQHDENERRLKQAQAQIKECFAKRPN